MYQNKHTKFNETKSTAFSFLLVSILGCIFLFIVDIDNLMLKLVMAAVFLIFFIIGAVSLLSLRKLAAEAVAQDDTWSSIQDWFQKDALDEVLNVTTAHLSEAEQYYPRAERIHALLSEQYPDLSEDELEYYTELLYNQTFTENN